jgi:hypothetical protein
MNIRYDLFRQLICGWFYNLPTTYVKIYNGYVYRYCHINILAAKVTIYHVTRCCI